MGRRLRSCKTSIWQNPSPDIAPKRFGRGSAILYVDLQGRCQHSLTIPFIRKSCKQLHSLKQTLQVNACRKTICINVPFPSNSRVVVSVRGSKQLPLPQISIQGTDGPLGEDAGFSAGSALRTAAMMTGNNDCLLQLDHVLSCRKVSPHDTASLGQAKIGPRAQDLKRLRSGRWLSAR